MYVYVIMPVSSDVDYAVKREVLRGVAVERNVELHLPLENIPPEGSAPESVLSEIAAADLVVADLSLERPSCYFELGLAQVLKKPNKLIAQEGTDIHQIFGRADVRFYRDIAEYRTVLGSILGAFDDPR